MAKFQDKHITSSSLNELSDKKIREIPIHTINMDIKLYRDENDYLVKQLKKLNLFKSDYRYSVIHPDCKDAVIEHGTYRFKRDGKPKDTIYCLVAGKDSFGDLTLYHCGAGSDNKWSVYANYVTHGMIRNGNPIPIVVYDSTKLKEADGDEYQFKCQNKREAVVAIVLLENY